MIFGGRHSGKSHLQKMFIDFALDNGKTIIVATPEIVTRQKRKGNLTLIEKLPELKRDCLVIYDEPHYAEGD